MQGLPKTTVNQIPSLWKVLTNLTCSRVNSGIVQTSLQLLVLAVLLAALILQQEMLAAGLWGERSSWNRELAVCIVKIGPCSIFTSSLFPARVYRKEVYSHLCLPAVFSETTWRNMILLLQLLNISPGRICVLYRAHIFVCGLEFFLSCQFVNSSTYWEKAEPSQKRVKFKRRGRFLPYIE